MRPSLRRVSGLLARHRWTYALGVACLLATNALNLAVPLILKIAFDGLEAGGTRRFAAACGAALLGVALVRAVIRTWSRLLLLGASRRVTTALREQVFAHLQALPLTFFDRMSTGDIVSRLISDLAHVRSLFGPVAMNLANTVALYAMAIVLLVRLDPLLTLVALVPYLAVTVFVQRFSKRVHRESTEAQEAFARISSRLSENLNGITVIKSHRREEEEIRAFDALCDEYYEANQRFARTRSVMVPIIGMVGGFGIVAVLVLGSLRVMDGTFSLGDFVAFSATLAMLSWPSIALGWILNAFHRGVAAMDRLEEILEVSPESVGEEASASACVAGPIEMRECTFWHPGVERTAAPALRAVSFRVERGGRLGIVGRTGSGKSTILELISGARRPDRGQVLVDGQDVLDVPPRRLREDIGAVPQSAFVFSTTIRDNVAYGLDEQARENRVESAIHDAAFEQDLAQLPHGLETVLGERGVTLSGGQRQRVTLARALAIEPELLLLDDSLSAVDAQTEREILARLEWRRRKRAMTEVIVSHRLSAVAECDEILVLEAGVVVERGTHAQLLAAAGRYATTWREQEISRELSEVE